MNGIVIDRMTLHAPGVSESDGRRLALAVADGLAAAGVPANAMSDVATLRVDLTAAATGAGTNALARQIVEEILRQVQRSP